MQSTPSISKFNQRQISTSIFRFYLLAVRSVSYYNTLSLEALLMAQWLTATRRQLVVLLIWFLAECDRRISCLTEVEVLQTKHQAASKNRFNQILLSRATCFKHWFVKKNKREKHITVNRLKSSHQSQWEHAWKANRVTDDIPESQISKTNSLHVYSLQSFMNPIIIWWHDSCKKNCIY